MTEERDAQWWIATNRMDRPHRKILGPFRSRELAMRVREYVEKVEGETFWVDSEPVSFYLGAGPQQPRRQ
jgi:hypothetical protein